MNVNDLKFGCVKGDEDPRDHKLAKVSTDWTQLSTIDLRSQCPPFRTLSDVLTNPFTYIALAFIVYVIFFIFY